mgnify:CR=1 FL=1
MSKIKLTGSNSGYVEISSAADAGNLTLALPTSGTRLLSDGNNVYTGITTFTNDLKLEGGSYDVLWDASDNQLEFDDNAKLSFGASSDLQLYHDGTHSYVDEVSNGNLILRTNPSGTYSTLVLQSGRENSVICNKLGSVELFHIGGVGSSTKRFETTAQGIMVTGHSELDNVNIVGVTTHQGHILPSANNLYDLGSTAKGWRNVYMNDLNLSNMNGDTNDVDGTQGSWTIQEGKDDLYIINRLNGKKFKIKMEEIS